MFGLSWEHLIILAIVLLVVGPKKLPVLGHTMGKAIKNFKDSMAGIQEPAYRHIQEEANKDAASKDTTAKDGAAQTSETKPEAEKEKIAANSDPNAKPRT
jgi:sec-independent protein translocase protein TatA